MRSFRHWTPRYIVNRVAEMRYQRLSPDEPWLTMQANQILLTLLKPEDVGVEFGSGRSTVWFAKRVRSLTSVEHNEQWYGKVQNLLATSGADNVDYILCPRDLPDAEGDRSAYVAVLDRFVSDKLDFALVDGVYRDHCALHALKKLRPGGVLIIDNVNRYLPSNSISPASRTMQQGPDGEVWRQVLNRLADWRSIWTSSGVTDTAFYFKPCHESATVAPIKE